jgi:hypothetical protein
VLNVPDSIPIEIRESQTKKVTAQKDTRPEFIGYMEKEPSPYFTRAEVEKAIMSPKSKPQVRTGSAMRSPHTGRAVAGFT